MCGRDTVVVFSVNRPRMHVWCSIGVSYISVLLGIPLVVCQNSSVLNLCDGKESVIICEHVRDRLGSMFRGGLGLDFSRWLRSQFFELA